MGFCWVKVVGSTRKNVELVGSSTFFFFDKKIEIFIKSLERHYIMD